MSSFDLIHEAWLPVLDAGADLRADAEHAVALREVGLQEALVRAHEIREIYTDAPLETIALCRLLLAIVIDGFLPDVDKPAWQARWEQGYFDPDAVARYFADPVRKDRFDLLHPERPFYQHPVPLAKEPSPLSKLFHAEASGNNATLFGHELDKALPPRTLAEAARGIVCAHAYSLAGLSGASRQGGRLPNFSYAPLVGGAVFWIRGRSLFEALLLNAPPDPNARLMIDEDDDAGRPPAWQQPLSGAPAKRRIEGYRDYLTLQARHLTLVTEQDENGVTVATGAYMAQGDKESSSLAKDPLMATVYPDKKKAPFPFGFRKGRALWRDASTFFKLYKKNDGGSPSTFWWLKRMSGQGGADQYAVDVFGLVNDQAKVELWRHERMPVFPALLADDPGQVPLHQVTSALNFAEAQRMNLIGAVRTVADYLLAPPAAGKDDKPKADGKAVRSLADALGAEARYWASLEPHFYDLLRNLAAAAGDGYDARQAHLWAWAETIYKAAKDTFDVSTAHLDQDARQLRAVAEGERRLGRVKEYRMYRNQKSEDAL